MPRSRGGVDAVAAGLLAAVDCDGLDPPREALVAVRVDRYGGREAHLEGGPDEVLLRVVPIVSLGEPVRSEWVEEEEMLGSASDDELNARRTMRVWGPKGDREVQFLPAHVLLRTQTHAYQHMGQITAMARLLGRPVPDGLDFPLA